MALLTPPPRKNPTPTKLLSKQNLTPLQTLLQMGFTKHRADKSLAATGNRGSVQLASDWLLAHVNDPYLDDNTPREYILYACPTGAFLQQLEDFWAKSREICGWNGAHNFMPHITLVSFFKAPDEAAPRLSKTVRQIVELAQQTKSNALQLELYTSPNFMGFFVGEDDANLLKRIALQFVKEVSDSIISDTYEQLDPLVVCFPWCSGVTSNSRCIPRSNRSISLDPHVKSLHLTLAYQFPSDQFNDLKSLVETLDPNVEASWELRLYSRDQRLATRQVHRIMYPYSAPPDAADELELMMGDYVYVNADSIQSSTDGWVEGISWLTGLSGFFPINYTERCAESEAWVMHKAVPLVAVEGSGSDEKNVSLRNSTAAFDESSTSHIITGNRDPGEVYRLLSEKSISYLNPLSSTAVKEPSQQSGKMNKNKTRIFVMRHGERVDFTFGNWLPYCWDNGSYVQPDLNMPKDLPRRSNEPQGWKNDSPVTNLGLLQARLIGEALQRNGIQIDRAYVSPAFRSVSTCSSALEGLGQRDTVPLNVEPTLFEWCQLFFKSAGVSKFDWLTTEELEAGGFNVNSNYLPHMSVKELESVCKAEESVEAFYERNGLWLDEIAAAGGGENILIVGHAATVEVCHQRLKETRVRSATDLNRLLVQLPYCSFIGMERDLEKGPQSQWTRIEGNYSVTNTANQRFDCGLLE